MRGIPHLGMVSVSQSTPIGLLHMALLTKQIRRVGCAKSEAASMNANVTLEILADAVDTAWVIACDVNISNKY